jgi:hypothetical protein
MRASPPAESPSRRSRPWANDALDGSARTSSPYGWRTAIVDATGPPREPGGTVPRPSSDTRGFIALLK